MDPDQLWDVVNQFVTLIHSRSIILLPSICVTEEPTQEDFDALCMLADAFEKSVQILGLVHWEKDGGIPLGATLDLPYARLTSLERVDAEARKTKSGLDHTAMLHDISIRQEGGPYPNDLSFAILHQLLRSISSLLHLMDQYRSWVRERIRTLAPHKLRPLTVLDLPDELLIQIFGHVRGPLLLYDAPFRSSFSNDVRDIQNVRLTCQRFYAASSHLLLDHVYVGLRPESLSRLEEISQHPTIGKGVRVVRLQLFFYYSELSSDLRRFAEVWSRSLAQDTDLLKHVARHPKSVTLFKGLSQADIDPTLEKCCSVLKAWEWLAHSGEDLPGSEAFVEVLRTAHREYQRLFDVQIRLLEHRGFVQAFASAIAQMSHAKSLVIDEEVPFAHLHRQPFYKAIHDPNVLRWTYLRALTTWSADQHGLDLSPSMDLVLDVLAAIPGAGASLRNVKIDIACVGDTGLLVSSLSTRRHISALSKQLGSASIHFGALQEDSSSNTRSDFYQLLLAILDSDSLENIDIRLDDIENEESKPFDIGPVLNHQKRPSLSNLSLEGVAIHATDLELFTGSLRSRGYLDEDPKSSYFRGVRFHLRELRLLSGTWMEVLDLLRAKSSRYPSIEKPSGAECDAMSKEEYDKVFTRPGNGYASSRDKPSLAEEYVQDPFCSHPNPLRAN